MSNFFKKYMLWLIFVFIVPLGVSYWVFTCDGIILTSAISKDMLLSFWGGYLAFYGTFFLGMIAIWQNEQAVEQNKRLLRIEDSRQSCNVVLKSIDPDSTTESIVLPNEKCDYKKAIRNMRFSIINHGDAMLKEIKISLSDDTFFSSHVVLAKGESQNVFVEIPSDLDCKVKAKIYFVSCNNITTYGDFNILFIGNRYAKMEHYNFYGLQKE
jgi:hypothetical protein